MQSPPSLYKLDELCSLELDKKVLQITLHNGLFNAVTVDRLLKKLDEFIDGRKFLTVINCEESARTTVKALRRMAEPSAMEYATAKAYVIKSVHQKAMADIYLTIFRPSKPVKFFNNIEAAREWLDHQ